MVKQTTREMLNSIEKYCKFGDITPHTLKQINLNRLIGEYKNLYYVNKYLQRAIISILNTCTVDKDLLSKKELNIINKILDKEYENRNKKSRTNTETSGN